MRTLIAAAATLLAVSAATPAFAAPLTTMAAGTQTTIQALPNTLTLVQTTSTKKKKKTTSKSKETATFQEIGNARRGKSDLEIKVKTSKSNRTCELKIEWNNDDETEDDADAKDDKICEFSIDVPDDRGVVGDAKATVTVKDSSGKKVATAKKTFTVK